MLAIPSFKFCGGIFRFKLDGVTKIVDDPDGELKLVTDLVYYKKELEEVLAAYKSDSTNKNILGRHSHSDHIMDILKDIARMSKVELTCYRVGEHYKLGKLLIDDWSKGIKLNAVLNLHNKNSMIQWLYNAIVYNFPYGLIPVVTAEPEDKDENDANVIIW